jgi:hypothetical protein
LQEDEAMGRSYRMKALVSRRNTYLKEEFDKVQEEEVEKVMEEAEINFESIAEED